MTFVTFFIIVWTIVGFAWQSTDIKHGTMPKWYRVVEQIILVPVTVIRWAKVAVNIIMEKVNAEKN